MHLTYFFVKIDKIKVNQIRGRKIKTYEVTRCRYSSYDYY